MSTGRSDAVKKLAGETILERTKACLAPAFERRLIGLSVQVGERPGQVYDGKHSTLHSHLTNEN